jgi:flagellar motor switch/type III secretory pathway protein FliN
MAAAPAIAPVSGPDTVVEPASWAHVLKLPCGLSVDLPLPGFKVGDLLRLQRQSVIDSHWHVGADVPLRLNGELIAHGEFEVVGNRLAVRITELA